MIQHGPLVIQLVHTIYFYQNMQHQVHPMHLSQGNGQKPHFLALFAQFMHFMHTYLIVHDLQPLPDAGKYLELPSYAILIHSEQTKSRKWQKNLLLLFLHYLCTLCIPN